MYKAFYFVLPFPGDALDHRCVYDAASSAAKCFRFICRRFLSETLTRPNSAYHLSNCPSDQIFLLIYLLYRQKSRDYVRL